MTSLLLLLGGVHAMGVPPPPRPICNKTPPPAFEYVKLDAMEYGVAQPKRR